MKIRILALAAIAAASLAGQASAHHSFAMFDRTKKVTLEGTVKAFEWTNPHSWIQLTVMDAATHKAVEWSIEAGSIKALMGRGWKRTSLNPGDKVVVVGYPRKDGQPAAGMISASVNGQTLD